MHWVLILGLAFDLAAVKSEPNLEKRSELALNNANTALDAARQAYAMGDFARAKADIEEIGDSVDLAYESLSETGKDPRKSPRYFKKAEIRTRELLRRLQSFGDSMNYSDRGPLDAIRERIGNIHDSLVQGIMSKKK